MAVDAVFLWWAILWGCGGPDDGSGVACPGPTCAEICGNGQDDDGDGDVDCADASCGAVCPEDCANGVDDNGDWIVDCADPLCTSTCDGDGDGSLGPQVGGDDCDDGDAAVSPSAVEVYHDGVDNDCDPATVDDDEDGDGARWPTDCDDADPDTYPGAPEVCGDGVVNDCAAPGPPAASVCFGVRSLATADHTLDGFETDHWAGQSLAAGDTDGDGDVDLVVGANGTGPFDAGAVYVVEGPLAPTTDLSTACALAGVGDSDWLGAAAANVGDVDRDGRDELVVSARYQDIPGNRAGAAYLLLDPCLPGQIGGSAFEISGTDLDEFGTSVAGAGDVNGDGVDDLVVGAPQRNFPQLDAGAVVVFAGPILGPLTNDDAWLTVLSPEANALVGQSVGSPGDLDGDGLADLAVGAPLSDVTGTDAGRVWVINEPLPGAVSTVDYLSVSGGQAGDQFGRSLATPSADLDGDGRVDLVVGAPLSDAGAVDGGAVLLFSEVFPTLTPLATLTGEAAGDEFGDRITVLRDVDRDGAPDLAVGAPRSDRGGVDSGAVFVFFGPFVGTRTADQADAVLVGEAAYDFAGTGLGPAGDVDGDGATDLLVGAPFHDGLASAAGRAYVITFGY